MERKGLEKKRSETSRFGRGSVSHREGEGMKEGMLGI
jgi:hypothetical protein